MSKRVCPARARTPRIQGLSHTPWSYLPKLAALALVASCAAVFAPTASAGCFTPPEAAAPAAPRLQFDAPVEDALNGDPGGARPGQAVGLWHTLFLTNGGQKYDETFQTIHSDGTEMMISNGLPPFLGNICVGAWKEAGGKVTLRHMTWNWNPDNTFAGTFVMVVTFKVDQHGNAYSGSWSAKNFDVDGNHIPDLDAEGTVTATRVPVG